MKTITSKAHKVLFDSFLYLSPIGILMLIFVHFEAYGEIKEKVLGQFLEIAFIYWFLCTIYILFAIIFNKNFRESIFTKLAGIKERDEREEIIVGKAMKSSFLFTLGLLVLLLAFSTTRTSKSVDASTSSQIRGSFTIGHLDFKGHPIEKLQKEIKGENHKFETYDIPLSKTSLILIIILAQILSFKIFARRYLLE